MGVNNGSRWGDEGVASLPFGSGMLCIWGRAFLNWASPSMGLCGDPFFPSLQSQATQVELSKRQHHSSSKEEQLSSLGVGRAT